MSKAPTTTIRNIGLRPVFTRPRLLAPAADGFFIALKQRVGGDDGGVTPDCKSGTIETLRVRIPPDAKAVQT